MLDSSWGLVPTLISRPSTSIVASGVSGGLETVRTYLGVVADVVRQPLTAVSLPLDVDAASGSQLPETATVIACVTAAQLQSTAPAQPVAFSETVTVGHAYPAVWLLPLVLLVVVPAVGRALTRDLQPRR